MAASRSNMAAETRISDVWMDGTEEVMVVEGVCPQSACGNKLYAFFFTPRDKTKVQKCGRCKSRVKIVLPGEEGQAALWGDKSA